MHLLIRVIRRRVFYQRDLVPEATEINLQSRYPGGILIPKIGELSSSAPPAETVIAPITLTAMMAAITQIGIYFMERSFLR